MICPRPLFGNQRENILDVPFAFQRTATNLDDLHLLFSPYGQYSSSCSDYILEHRATCKVSIKLSFHKENNSILTSPLTEDGYNEGWLCIPDFRDLKWVHADSKGHSQKVLRDYPAWFFG